MESKSFKAETIMVSDGVSPSALSAAFNAWVEANQPASILQIHFYHDPISHTKGFQVVYEESLSARQPRAPEELDTRFLPPKKAA